LILEDVFAGGPAVDGTSTGKRRTSRSRALRIASPPRQKVGRGLVFRSAQRSSGEGQLAFIMAAKRRAQAAVLPAVFLALCGYFAYHATHGTRGLLARDARTAEIAAARTLLASAEAERDAMERKVSGLRSDRLDRDVLEERARAC
jgi:cell division protein FtsB